MWVSLFGLPNLFGKRFSWRASLIYEDSVCSVSFFELSLFSLFWVNFTRTIHLIDDLCNIIKAFNNIFNGFNLQQFRLSCQNLIEIPWVYPSQECTKLHWTMLHFQFSEKIDRTCLQINGWRMKPWSPSSWNLSTFYIEHHLNNWSSIARHFEPLPSHFELT